MASQKTKDRNLTMPALKPKWHSLDEYDAGNVLVIDGTRYMKQTNGSILRIDPKRCSND